MLIAENCLHTVAAGVLAKYLCCIDAGVIKRGALDAQFFQAFGIGFKPREPEGDMVEVGRRVTFLVIVTHDQVHDGFTVAIQPVLDSICYS